MKYNIDYCKNNKVAIEATSEEVKEYLIGVAKKKGFVDGIKLKEVVTPDGTTNWAGEIDGIWEYDLKIDELCCHKVPIYNKGVWSTIKPQKETISVGGKFDVTIDGNKIYHYSDDITTFVKELVAYAEVPTFSIYAVKIKDITFSKTGCQDVQTTLGDWLHVWDMYNKLQK